MSLWSSKDPARWQAQLGGYWTAVESHPKEKLLALDRWYFEELPAVLASREPAYLTKEELVKLVEWKLTRGKMRPNLLNYAKSSDAAAVKAATQAGLALLEGAGGSDSGGPGEGPSEEIVKKALAEVTVLKGVGPATASAVLAAAEPSVPFMSDEALNAALGGREYTVPQYMQLLGVLRDKAAQLTAASKGERVWTARDIERCLFAEAAAAKCAAGGGGGRSGKQAPAKKRKR